MTSEEKQRLLAAYDRACLNAALANRGMYLLGSEPTRKDQQRRPTADAHVARNLGGNNQELPELGPGSDDPGSNPAVS